MVELKRVSFNIAKMLKEIGYPQKQGENYWYKEGSYLCKHSEPTIEIYYKDDYFEYSNNLYYAPTYLEAWLWLWREKGIYIDIAYYGNNVEVSIWGKGCNRIKYIVMQNADPEECIIASLEYLVDNNLIN